MRLQTFEKKYLDWLCQWIAYKADRKALRDLITFLNQPGPSNTTVPVMIVYVRKRKRQLQKKFTQLNESFRQLSVEFGDLKSSASDNQF